MLVQGFFACHLHAGEPCNRNIIREGRYGRERSVVCEVMIYERGSSSQRWCAGLLIGEIKDKAVYSKNMILLGKAKDLEFDQAEMKVTHLIVEFEKDVAKDLLGKLIVIRHAGGKVPTELIESIEDAIVLKQPKNELKGSIESL
jgi:sporulation protein YlmC with PRC-barrel domain